MEALVGYEGIMNPDKVQIQDEEEDTEDEEDQEDEGTFLIPGAPPACATELPDDNEDSNEEEEGGEEEKHVNEPVPNPAIDEPVTTLAELAIDIPWSEVVIEDVYEPAAPMNSH